MDTSKFRVIERCNQQINELIVHRMNEWEIDQLIDRLVKVKRDIMFYVDMLEEPKRSVIYKRYILNMNWERISDETGYNSSTVRLLHDAAMRDLKRCP